MFQFPTKIKKIAVSKNTITHTMFLLDDGTVYAAGDNSKYQLGLGDNVDRKVPTLITAISNVDDVVCSVLGTFFIKKDGTVYFCGQTYSISGTPGEVHTETTIKKVSGMPVAIKKIATMDSGAAYLAVDGTVYVTGQNLGGQLGIPGSASGCTSPAKIPNFIDIVDISCGASHTVYLKNDGTAYAAGSNSKGQLGLGHFNPTNAPVKIASLTGVKEIQCGYEHSLILTGDGTAYTCGGNTCLQLGNGAVSTAKLEKPTAVLTGVDHIVTGYANNIFFMSDGTMQACGYNSAGQCGAGSHVEIPKPVDINFGCDACFPGVATTFFVKNGFIYACGLNNKEQAGVPDALTNVPTIVLEHVTPVNTMTSISAFTGGMSMRSPK